MKDHQVAHFGTQLCSFYLTDMKSNRLLGSKEMTLEWELFVLPYLQCMLKCFRFNDILNQASQIWHQSIHHHWFWTFYSLKTAAFHFMMYKKESYGCVNDQKLWSHWIRNWEEEWRGEDHELSHAAITQRMEKRFDIKYMLHTTKFLTQDFLLSSR